MRFIIQVWTHTLALLPIAAPILMLRVRCVIFWVSCWGASQPPQDPPLYSRNYTIYAEEPILMMHRGRMLQRVAVCCSVLQYAAVCCSVLQSVAAWCGVTHYTMEVPILILRRGVFDFLDFLLGCLETLSRFFEIRCCPKKPYICIYMYVCKYIFMYVSTHSYIYILEMRCYPTKPYTYTYTYIYVYTYIHTYVCVHTYTYIYTRKSPIHIYIYIYIVEIRCCPNKPYIYIYIYVRVCMLIYLYVCI